MTSIIDILRTVEESCDFGNIHDFQGKNEDEKRTNFWIEVISSKAADTGFGHLVDSIIEEGFHGSAIGWNADTGYISEGHHRLVAAILLGMDEVPTTLHGTNGAHAPRGRHSDRFSAHWNLDEHPIPVNF